MVERWKRKKGKIEKTHNYWTCDPAEKKTENQINRSIHTQLITSLTDQLSFFNLLRVNWPTLFLLTPDIISEPHPQSHMVERWKWKTQKTHNYWACDQAKKKRAAKKTK